MNDEDTKKTYTRRDMLKMTAAASAGLVIGVSGLDSLQKWIEPAAKGNAGEPTPSKSTPSPSQNTAAKQPADDTVSFHGEHQAGIVTPQQTYVYLAGFNLETDDKSNVIDLFRQWTKLAKLYTVGNWLTDSPNNLLPPNDTSEALGISPGRLTMTFGLGPGFFMKDGKDRFGFAGRIPKYLKQMPKTGNEELDESVSYGDLCVQVCSDDKQVAFHAVRNLINNGIGSVSLRWLQEGFFSGAKGETKRNLFGYKDGTANAGEPQKIADVIWSEPGEPDWMNGGTYLAYRKIKMLLDVWDLSSVTDQENTFGRYKQSGAAFGSVHEFDPIDVNKMPMNAHVRIAHTAGEPIHRRAYNYTDGLDPRTGKINAGLAMIAYQKNPDKSFIPMLKKMGQMDALNEYIDHVASAMFAIPRGARDGEYVAQPLLEA